MRCQLYGQRSERGARLLDQMELELEELEAAASEDEFAAERAVVGTTVRGFTRKIPSRKPFPEHLPRERIVVPGPTSCACCGSTRLAKLGEDVTETRQVNFSRTCWRADPGHKRHAEMIKWHGDSFDLKAVDLADTDRAIQDTARRWSRPRKTKPI
jgi:hypothetical protein